jgi:cholesterol transport system auxiliary component
MTHTLLSRRRVFWTGVYLLPLSGCSLLFPPSAPQLYRLTLRADGPTPGPLVRRQLVIAVPVAPEGLDTDRIALTRNQTMLDYFAGSAWTDRAPLLVQALIIEAFQNSGRIVAVGRDSSDLNPDYLLQTELRDLQARYGGSSGEPPTVVVRVVAELVKMPDRKIIASMLASRQAPAARNDVDSIVEAFDSAVGAVLSQIVGWTLRAMTSTR